jgi:hypothetical protein
MQLKYLILIELLFCGNLCAQHKVISQFEEFAANADMDCYERKIQQDLDKFDKWLIDSLPVLRTFEPWYVPGNVNLQKENKVFALAVSLANTENYRFKDNIYDYLIIDSLRTFIAVCIDEKMNVTGITDMDEPGTFYNLKNKFYDYCSKKWKNVIKNINKENPDLILYCEGWWLDFLYIKDGKIYVYNYKKRKGQEFNEYIRGWRTGIDSVKKSNRMSVPYSKHFNDNRNIYRLTGHTPTDEVRICP